MVIFVFILVVFIVFGRVIAVRKRPSQPAVIFTISVVLSGVGFACQVFPDVIDHAVHVVNFSDILHHSLSIIIMMLSLLYVTTLSPPHRVQGKSVRYACLVSVGLVALLWIQWLSLPSREVESAGDASGWQTLTEPLAFVTVIYNAFIIGGFTVLVWQCVVGSKDWFAGLPLLRRASTVMGIGIALMAVSQLVLVVRIFAPHDYQALTATYWAVVCLQSVVFSTGLFLPVAGRVLQQVRTQRQQLSRLEPLWRRLTNWFPDTELHTEKVWTAKKLSVTTTRRFVEISDCLSRLMLPVEDVDVIIEDVDPVRSLGLYLSTYQPKAVRPDNGEPASAVLPMTTSPEAEREQMLALADAFRTGQADLSAPNQETSQIPVAEELSALPRAARTSGPTRRSSGI